MGRLCRNSDARERRWGKATDRGENKNNMAAMAGLINHQLAAGQSLTAGSSLTGAQALAGKSANAMTAQTTGTSSTGSSGSSSATISANDFLTLLVTEMQNQDPTADTDPNEYINQLVQVNSLEQLIDINQNLTTALGTGGSTSGSSTSQPGATKSNLTGAGPAGANPASGANAPAIAAAHKPGAMSAARAARSGAPRSRATGSTAPGSNTAAAISQFAQSVSQKRAPGNLSVPAAKPAAHRVAHALDGHSHAPKIPGKPPVSQ
jgi:flagellar basal-body rod modification protein FlgD